MSSAAKVLERDGGRQARFGRFGRSSAGRESRRAKALANLVAKLVVLAVLLGVWQLVVKLWLPDYLPTPTGVVSKIGPTLADPSFADALGDSVRAILLGLAIGCAIGIPFGVITGRSDWLRRFAAPYVGGLYALPLLVLVPTATIWLGYSSAARLFLIVIAAALPCVVNTARGAQLAPKSLIEVAQILGVSKPRVLLDVVLPATLPFVVGGVQVAVGRAVIAAVSVEFIASLKGVGSFILVNAQAFHQNEAFVALLILAALGAFGRVAIEWLLRWLAPWQRNA